MPDLNEKKVAIIGSLKEKSSLKQRVFDNTFESFTILKDVLKNLSKEINTNLTDLDPRIRLEYTDRSNFDAQLKVASDLLLFSMHSNIFQFDREHPAWKTPCQAEAKIQHSRVITGKRLGFQFNSDDVLNSNPDET